MDPFRALPKDIQIPFLKTRQDRTKKSPAGVQILLAVVGQLKSLKCVFAERPVDAYRSGGIAGGFR